MLLIVHNHQHRLVQPSLFNPISAIQFQPPALTVKSNNHFIIGAISGPSSHRDSTVLIEECNDIVLSNLGNVGGEWTKLPLPGDIPRDIVASAVYCRGKFYCVYLSNFYIVNPLLPLPSVEFVEMDYSQLPLNQNFDQFSIESDGEVLAVLALLYNEPNPLIEEFQLFRMDCSRNMWVRVESIGDRVIFLDYFVAFLSVAGDVCCRKNCIYFTVNAISLSSESELYEPWKVFDTYDLETESLV